MSLILWLAACGGGDPELTAQREALEAWERGRERLEAGDTEGAIERFRAAQRHRSDALLVAWEAQALADAGQLEAAVDRMADALTIAPPLAEARYNRAAWLARLGRAEESGAELQRAIDEGAARSLEVLEDPDFAEVLDHPAFSFLPREAVLVAVDPPPESAFWGSEVQVRLRLRGLVRPPVRVEAPAIDGPAEVVRAEEVWMPTSDPAPGVDLTWTLRIVGAGTVRVGPFEVAAGPHETRVDAVQVEASAPPGKTPDDDRLRALLVPSKLADAVPADSAGVVDGRLVVHGRTTDRIEPTPRLASPARLDWQKGDEEGVLFVFNAPAEQVRVVRSGQVVFDGPPR